MNTPSTKDALAADAILKAYNDANPVPRIIDPTATTDLSNVKRFVQLHQRNIRYVPLWNCWMIWDGKRWVEKKKDVQLVPLVEEMIRDLEREAASTTSEKTKDKLMKHANQTESEARIMACIRLAASQPEIQATPDDFDMDKYLLNFQNGTVDLRTKEMLDFRREDMITRICAVPYIPGEIPLWQGFVNKIFASDTEVIEYMQKFLGMAFTGDVSEELFHVFHGGGANGKTTMLTTMNNILGNQYFRTMGVETLLKRGQKAIANDIARLQGARIVWANEPEFDDVLTEGKIKKMVSKERILGEMKFKEPVEFTPEYSLILSTNPKPKVRGVSKGWKRRLRFIPFNVEIKDNEKDIHFAETLIDELPGIAAWVIDGCWKWQKEGLIPPEKILIATEDYLEETDPLAELFNIYFIKEPQAQTPFILFYTVYKIWAEQNKFLIMKPKAFSQAMQDRGYKITTSRYSDGRQFKGFEQITLRGYNNNNQSMKINNSSGNNPTANEKNLVTDCAATSEENLFKSVTDFLMAPDYERQEKYEALLPIVTHLSNPFHITGVLCVRENNSNISNIGNSITNINNNESVTSVTLVTEIIKLLKEKYDHFNKPDSILDLGRLQISMEAEILNEIEGSEDVDIMKIIDAYWQERDKHGNTPQIEKIKIVMDIIRQAQDEHKTATSQDYIIAKASEVGIAAEIATDMLGKLKFAGELIEVSEGRYRVI